MKWNHPLAVHGVDQAEVPQFRSIILSLQLDYLSLSEYSDIRLKIPLSPQQLVNCLEKLISINFILRFISASFTRISVEEIRRILHLPGNQMKQHKKRHV